MKAIATACMTLLAGGLMGCSPEENTAEADSDWSIEREAVRFKEDLYVSEAEDFFIGSADDVAARSDGRIYVADDEEHHIKVLSPNGELLETIGREGEGPGEFEQLSEIALARGDSLYVLDGSADRVSVFTPDHDFAYSFVARTEEREPSRIMVPTRHSGYIIAYPLPYRPGDEGEDRLFVRRVSARGTTGDTLFTARPSQEIHVAEIGGRMWHFYGIPFARSSHFALGSDGSIHYAWSDSLRVRSYDESGRLLGAIAVPFEAVLVTGADWERVMDGWSSERRAALRSVVRDTKPAFTRFLIDDERRYWFKRPTDDRERVDWWIVDADERRVLTGRMPAHVDFSVVRDGYAYGTIEGSDERLPAVVRYRVEAMSNGQ